MTIPPHRLASGLRPRQNRIAVSHTASRLLLAVAVAAGLGPSVARAADVRRNIIFILSDDHRFDFLGFMPEAPKFLDTPHLDRLAKEGCHLRNAFVSTSLCSPSRASILTGQYMHHHRVVDNQRPEPDSIRFFPEYLQAAGYQTAFFGKWHMGHDSDAPRRGFHHWAGFRGQGEYFDPTLNINGTQQKLPGYSTDVLTDLALEWLKQPHSQPFFLYLAHTFPHQPLAASTNFAGKSQAGKYGDAVEEIDWSVGQIVAALDRAGISDNTQIGRAHV